MLGWGREWNDCSQVSDLCDDCISEFPAKMDVRDSILYLEVNIDAESNLT